MSIFTCSPLDWDGDSRSSSSRTAFCASSSPQDALPAPLEKQGSEGKSEALSRTMAISWFL